MNNVLDIFYNYIVPEASRGKINSFFSFFTIFSTEIPEEGKSYIADPKENEEYLVPTLFIRNKKRFDEALIEYVHEALDFYDNSCFYPEVINKEGYEIDRTSKEKTIIALAFSNFTPKDFNDPALAFKKRTEYIRNGKLEEVELGYSEILDCNLKVQVEKEHISNETPYKYQLIAYKGDNTYLFPRVRVGIFEDSLHIYSIQSVQFQKDINDPNIDKEEAERFVKKINRKLYKINGELDESEDITVGIDNVNDITPSFVLAATSALSFYRDKGIEKAEVPPILIVRANAKKKVAVEGEKSGRISVFYRRVYEKDADIIQTNLTQKLLRTFLRVSSQVDGINVYHFPTSPAETLMLRLDEKLSSKNVLLEEIQQMSKGSGQKCK